MSLNVDPSQPVPEGRKLRGNKDKKWVYMKNIPRNKQVGAANQTVRTAAASSGSNYVELV